MNDLTAHSGEDAPHALVSARGVRPDLEHRNQMTVAGVVSLECLRCHEAYPVREMPVGCPKCLAEGYPAAVVPNLDLSGLDGAPLVRDWSGQIGSIWRFDQLLPVPRTQSVSLNEGGTPLLHLETLSDRLGVGRLFVKDECRNPTGSFKDRFFSVVVSRARQAGAEVVTVASSGNGGSSAAAYAAAAGLRCVVFTTPSITTAWRAAISVTGATLIATAEASERWDLMRTGADELGWYPLTNYVTPPMGSSWYGIEGYKTIAYEIAESLGWEAPDWVVVPTSRGDGLSGIWRGFVELEQLGITSSLPRMVAAERFPSLTIALRDQLDYPVTVPSEPTIAASIGSNAQPFQALETVRRSSGTAITCDDQQLREMMHLLGRSGLFVEASSAASVCGAKQLVELGLADENSTIVSLITASGLNDPGHVIQEAGDLIPIPPTVEALRDVFAGARGTQRS